MDAEKDRPLIHDFLDHTEWFLGSRDFGFRVIRVSGQK